jgi:hypothetical protein
VSHLWRYFGVHVFHKKDRRSTQQWWYRYRHMDGPITIPLVNNMQIHLRSNEPLDPPAVVQRRRVRRDVAKPIREKIADWEKLATSYLALEDNFKMGMLVAYTAKLPELEDEVTMDGLLRMMRYGAERGNGYALYGISSWRTPAVDFLRQAARRAFKNAFERWKEELYTEHGAFTWVDKAA